MTTSRMFSQSMHPRRRPSTGSSRSEYEDNYSVSAGVSGSYNGFTASIEANFSSHSLSTSEHSFGTWRHLTQKKKLTLFQHLVAADLMNSLSPSFRKDIGLDGGTRLTPEALIMKYGTHVVTGYSIGGVLEYSMSADASSMETSTDWGIALQGGFEAAAYGVSASTSYSQFNSMKNSSASFESTLRCRGGQSQYSSMTAMGTQSMYNEWLSSLEDPSQWVMVNYENPMIPIFDFVEDAAYKAEIKTYLNDYLKGLTTPQNSSHKNLKMELISVQTNMDDAGDTGEFSWSMAVKVDNTPLKGGDSYEWGRQGLDIRDDMTAKLLNTTGTVRLSPLKGHTVKIEVTNAHESDTGSNDHFNDKTSNVVWDGSKWSIDGTYLNDENTFTVRLDWDQNNSQNQEDKEYLYLNCKLVWE